MRSAEVLRALRAQAPDLVLHALTDAPRELLPMGVHRRLGSPDVGVSQPDALRIDELATLRRAARMAHVAREVAEREAGWLRGVGARLVVADIPPIPFLAAAAAGVPSVGIANFSWDWIYRAYVAAHPHYGWVPEWIAAAYACASLLLRLPYAGDLSAFRQIEDIPLVARRARRPAERVRAAFGLADERRPLVLLSFGGLGLGGLEPELLARLDGYHFLVRETDLPATPPPPNVTLLSRAEPNYADLVGAVDVVVSKPGYGIVADCLAQRTPIVYTDRGDFPEYPILVEGLERDGRAVYLPQDELRAGRLGPYLERALALDKPWPEPRLDGAEVAARRLLEVARDGA